MAAGFSVLLFVFERLTGVPLDVDSLLSPVMAGAGLLSWYLLKSRHFASVTWLMVATLVLVATVSTLAFGSSRTVSIVLLPVAQVGVGIFLGEQALMAATIALIALFGGLTYLDAAGFLPGTPTFVVGWRTWITHAACLISVAMMMYLNRTQFKDAEAQHVKEAHHRLKIQLDRDLGLDRFQRFFHSSPTPFFIQSSRTGHIVDANAAFERATGYTRDTVVNQRDGFLWLHDDEYAVFSKERRSSRRTDWLPVTIVRKDGRHVSLMVSSERDDDPEDGLVINALCWPEDCEDLDSPTGLIPLAAYEYTPAEEDDPYLDTVFDQEMRDV